MKRADIKNHIIETASFLFYTRGYNLTGINEIISEAGIAKATLYNHFRSKEEICLAYLQHKHLTFLTDIKEFCESKPSGKNQVLAVFDFLDVFFQDRDFNGCWCIKTVSEIPKDNIVIRSEIQKQKKELIEFINLLISKNLKENEVENIDALSKQIYLLYEGAVAESHLHQQQWPIEQSRNLCKRII